MTINSYSQASEFVNITTADGLPSNYVFDLSEDENGFLWAGTDKGLTFYNGFNWQTYNTDNLLPGNYVDRLFCNGNGGIWLNIGNKGLFYFDINKKRISSIPDFVGSFYSFTINDSGNLFFTKKLPNNQFTSYTINKYTPTKVFLIPTTKDVGLSGKNTATNNDSKINTNGFYDKKTSLIKLNNQSKIIRNYKASILKNKPVNTSLENDSIYFSKDFENVYRLKPNGSIITKHLFDHTNKSINILPHNGGYWIYNNLSKIYYTDKYLNKIQEYSSNNSLSTPLVERIYFSKKGQTMFCTMGGGIQILMPKGIVAFKTENSLVKSIAIEKNKAYAVTEKKLFVFSLSNDSLLHKYNLRENQIMNINAKDDIIYISTLAGVSIYKIINNQLLKKQFVKISAGASSVIKFNNKPLVSTFGNGINFLNTEFSKKKDTKNYLIIEKLLPLSFGFAALNYDDGVYLFDNNQNEIAFFNKANGLLDNAVYHVFEVDKQLWISTTKGVSIIQNNKIDKKISVPSLNGNNKCLIVFKDTANKIWMVGNKFLYRFSNDNFIQTTSLNLIDNEEDKILTAAFNSKTNTLIIGTKKQTMLVKMGAVKINSEVKIPVLLQTFYDSKPFDKDQSTSFSYNTNDISFNFKPSFTDYLTKSSIFYKLQGFDNSYKQLTDSLELHFSKLRPNNYTLYAKTINADGFESIETKLCSFTIKKPFWQQGWFMASILFWAIFITVKITQHNNKKRQQHLEKEKKLTEQLITERERISKELHDNLGANLVTMIAQTDNIENNLLNNNIDLALQKTQLLSCQSRETINLLRETIWAVQENEHSLNDFVLRVKNYLQRVLPISNIEWLVEINGDLSKKLSPPQTLHLFRIIQETTQNTIKHANATYLSYLFEEKNDKLNITINDNGRGFNVQQEYNSNGIKNMKSRVADLGGNIQIISSNGTTIYINFTI